MNADGGPSDTGRPIRYTRANGMQTARFAADNALSPPAFLQNARAVRLADALMVDKPTAFARRAASLAEAMQDAASGQVNLMTGQPPTTAETFDGSFGPAVGRGEQGRDVPGQEGMFGTLPERRRGRQGELFDRAFEPSELQRDEARQTAERTRESDRDRATGRLFGPAVPGASDPAFGGARDRTDAEQAAREWAEQGTRSRWFRRWFGDWTLTAKLDEPVPVIGAKPEARPVVAAAKAWAAQNLVGKALMNDDFGVEFAVSGRSISKITSAKAGDPNAGVRAAAVWSLPELVKEARGFVRANTKADDHQTRFVYELFAPFTFRGKTYSARIIAKDYPPGIRRTDKVHSLRIEDVLINENAAGNSQERRETGAVPSAASQVTLRDLIPPGSLPPVSRVVNPDGSPRVLYHGTSKQFTQFVPQDAMYGKGVYLAESQDRAALYGDIIMPVYARHQAAAQPACVQAV